MLQRNTDKFSLQTPDFPGGLDLLLYTTSSVVLYVCGIMVPDQTELNRSPGPCRQLAACARSQVCRNCDMLQSWHKQGSVMGVKGKKRMDYTLLSWVPGYSSSTGQWYHHRSQVLHSLLNTGPAKRKHSSHIIRSPTKNTRYHC